MANLENKVIHDPGSEKPKSPLALYFSLPILSWALYDFANTIFSSNIITIFFPFYLQEVIGTNERMDQSQVRSCPMRMPLPVSFSFCFHPCLASSLTGQGKGKGLLSHLH